MPFLSHHLLNERDLQVSFPDVLCLSSLLLNSVQGFQGSYRGIQAGIGRYKEEVQGGTGVGTGKYMDG